MRIHPAPLTGTVTMPGDKSLSHRALLIGALADGPVEVEGLAASGDIAAMAAALEVLGAEVSLTETADGKLGGVVRGPLAEATDVIDCGNSGTALRLLAGVVAGIDGVAVFTGDASLRSRPVERVAAPLRAMGATILARDGGQRPPMVVRGGGLRGVRYNSPVASAQVKSCVLLAGLHADGPTTVSSPFPSRDHTERLLTYLGVPVERNVDETGQEVVDLEPSTPAARPIPVSGDPSSAAFWLVAAAAGAGEITLPGICANPTRLGVVAVLEQMGASISIDEAESVAGEPVAQLRTGPAELTGTTVEGRLVVDAIDELPILAVAGALSRDGLEVRDAAELRVKESDRITVLAGALRQLGVEVEERADGYRVAGGQRPGGGIVDAHGDHRIAMTAAIAGTLGTGPVEVQGFASVAASYPTFLDDLRRLGGEAEVLATT